ncbi:MAG TPA: SGNH/GDSL hydrolase family protein [Pirellulaceae bacterium]|jgi:acyl-CoA thioesterase-1|nr:SGNH/GDSL hydrolase family protein [Pirellulaceae bacterium]
MTPFPPLRRHSLPAFLLAATVATAISFAEEPSAIAPASDQPRILILGDSISIGYTPYVQETLEGEAFVYRPLRANGSHENCADTTNGVAKIDEWLAREGGDWDVIHVNFGLHDLKHVKAGTKENTDDPNDPHQVDLQTHREQYDAILAKCKATGARLIVATTTPVPEAPVPEGKVRPYRAPADVLKYNAVAKELAEKHGAAVDDLFAFAAERLAEIQLPANVHFTDAGSKALAEKVVESLRKEFAAAKAD